MEFGRRLRSGLARWPLLMILALGAPSCGRNQSQEPAFPAQDPDVPRILVIPFENIGSPEDTFFAAGLTRDITTRLAAVRGLGFVSQSGDGSSPAAAIDSDVVAADLGADFLLEGSVLWDQDAEISQQLYVEARLRRVADGEVLWSDRAVRPMADVFSIQSSICNAIVDRMGVPLNEQETLALGARPTDNVEAYLTYLRALTFSLSFERAKLEQAEKLYRQAVALDPAFAVAHAALSENHSLIFHFRYDRSPPRLASANAAAERAREIDPNLPEGHRATGYYYYWGQRNYELALSEFSLAAHGRPNDPSILAAIGLVLRRQGRWQEAIDAMQRAVEMEPENGDSILDLGSTLSRVRRYEDAGQYCRRAIELAPLDVYPYVFLTRTLMLEDGGVERARDVLDSMPEKDPTQENFYRYQLAMFDRDYPAAMDALVAMDDVISDPINEVEFTRSLAECECGIFAGTAEPTSPPCLRAREFLERERRDSPADPAIHAALGWLYALTGEKEGAIEAGERAVELMPITADAMSGHTYLVMLARIYAWVDEPYLAVKTIHTAMSTPGWISVATLETNPVWDPIKDDPRFQELLRMYSEGE